MKTLRILAYIAAAILILFGVLFILGAFSPQSDNPGGWLLTGFILVGVGFVLIFIGAKVLQPRTPEQPQQVTLQVDLPGTVSMDTIKCQSCGGTLQAENIQVVNGAPMVTCPYCHTVYQITEQPKW
ncbi:MAG TPA: hypothetical protein PKV95_10055 [Anaerolineaceae bacterium]|nr:hypothetical protein [Anaerolineaceae bacterium]HQF46029.1 hypothetical protein [Anaerolineaceae bacterium]HQJ03075.1 hypothetical protein [Anaerolineaceae bacterium]HQL39810.1 hypothetical protein [Anaerolineaceae bacterium]